jgi:spore germination protein GerM
MASSKDQMGIGDSHYSEQKSQRRLEELVKAALNTRLKPLKSMTRKGAPAQSKKRRKAK